MNAIVDGREDEIDTPLSVLLTATTDGRHEKCTCAVFVENCTVMSGDCSRSGNVCSKCVSCLSLCRVDSTRAEWMSACDMFVVVRCTFTMLEKMRQNCFYFNQLSYFNNYYFNIVCILYYNIFNIIILEGERIIPVLHFDKKYSSYSEINTHHIFLLWWTWVVPCSST